MSPEIYEGLLRLGLVLLGGLLGSSLTQYQNRRRLRSLTPLALAQLQASAKACTEVFSVEEASACSSSLESSSKIVAETVGAGIDRAHWAKGFIFIEEARQAIAAVTSGPRDSIPVTTEKLRRKGHDLLAWVAACPR